MRALASFIAAAIFSLGASASFAAGTEKAEWHRLVGILQYLQADYPLALESRSEFEMREQNAFIDEAIAAGRSLGPDGERFLPRLEHIRSRIRAAEDPRGVQRDCGALIEELVAAGGLVRAPRRAPDLERGEQLYGQLCVACHAADGSANVAIAATMEPPPANFRDPNAMGALTPYQAFNTIGFGVKGTQMAGFAPAVNEDDRWALSFFVFTLRHPECSDAPPKVSLEVLATSSDADLAARYGEAHVACLRRALPELDEDAALLSARSGVEDAVRLALSGDGDAARRALLDAYLESVEPVEPLLSARDAALVRRIEEGVLRLRVVIESGKGDVEAAGQALVATLDAARAPHARTSAWAVFWMALLILLREGFEALVVIAALLAVLKRMDALKHARVVHAGWIAALVVGAGAFLFGRHLIAGAQREWVEGVVALAAVVMLLYAAVWLNARANVSAFMKGLRNQMEGALGRGSVVGLFAISFSAVGRETLETALFLQGLALDSVGGAVWGAIAGSALLVALVLFVTRVGFRLPMKLLFRVSTALLFATAVVLLGKGLHALQETGALPVWPLGVSFSVGAFGIYSDGWTLLAQVALASSPLVWRTFRGPHAPEPERIAAPPTERQVS